MKIILREQEFNETPERLLQRAGYNYQRARSGQESMVRRVGRGNFPRFHAYINREGDKVIINLHLDQKQPSYGVASAHSGEYEGEVVEKEIERLKSYITHNQ